MTFGGGFITKGTMGSYFRVRLSRVPLSLEEDVTAGCFAKGCLGLSEALNYVQKDLTYDPDVLNGKTKEIDVFFAEKPKREFYTFINEVSPQIQTQEFEEEEKDWLAEWKKGFVPFKLVGPFWVVPSWIEAPPEAEIPLLIDPGMAFGTGTHATTQLAAALTHKVIKSGVPIKSVIDVGTGTGILALVAKKMGVSKVVGVDIDPEARRVAKENVVRNQEPQIQVPDLNIEDINEKFDLVIANIIDGVLIKIKEDLVKATKPGGHLILTGILLERENHFLENFLEDPTLEIDRRIAKDEWVGFLVRKKIEA